MLRNDDYLHSIMLSKAVVSPWGWGEACHRDYEAMLLGTLVIKPPMDHVACWPYVYDPDLTYIECRMDFADVSDIVERVVTEWPQWRARRLAARQLALDAGEPKRVAKRIADILEGVL